MKLPGDVLDAPLAIVDLETTGAHPVHDRITEIAVIEVEDGEVRSEWSTLVDPQTSIPPAIQALTGITNAMVAGAPTFAALAADLFERLEGRVVVAHNARFDYGFLKQEFERQGLRYNARTLCTVRLSRKLYPEHARHNLDALMTRHGIVCQARHRALGDAQVLWEFLGVATRERGFAAVSSAAHGIARQPTLPAAIDPGVIDAIDDAPGVYLFHGEGGAPLYVGKSVTLRTRVLAHFADDVRSSRDMQIARETRSIETIRTCGELGALLKEAELVKTLLPVFNRQRRRATPTGPKLLAWPYRGPVGLIEKDEAREATDIHELNNWCYLGTARTDDELAALLESPPAERFDLDQYKILVRFLAAKARAKPAGRIVELPAFSGRDAAENLCTAN